MAYLPEESIECESPFWEHAGEYTSENTDDAFINEMSYLLVTLYRSEVT